MYVWWSGGGELKGRGTWVGKELYVGVGEKRKERKKEKKKKGGGGRGYTTKQERGK
jgi:hypothetical protein